MKKPGEIISKILAPALRLWLRSQVEQVEALEIEIAGGDRQILKGYIPSVFLSSRRTVYRGLQLGAVQLEGENIQINLGQILKGKPLRLLEPLQVTGNVCVDEADLQASLASSLFSNALTDLLSLLLEASALASPLALLKDLQVSWQAITLNEDKFTLRGTLTDATGNIDPLLVRAGLESLDPQTLCLRPVQIEGVPGLLPVSLTELLVDLGSDVKVEALHLKPGQLSCWGRLVVRP